MMNTNIEILSPAGSFEALKAAIDSGADAVYFGGRAFSARKNAVNLSNEEITEALSFAHLRGARMYAAVNTLMTDTELAECFDFIKFCYESGVDGIIVQDPGLCRIIRKHFPDFRIHASTQMTVHNLAGVKVAEKMGFSRVVLSRELSFDDIKYIAQNTNLELEVFVHGALCMSYSGQCLMSSFLGGRSGNRGACAQPCRLPYTLLNSQGDEISQREKYLLSLKDLCLVEYISQLKEAGVTSLKIEGRMKSAAYVSGVTGIYNKYRNGGKVSPDNMELLKNIFSRDGFTQGHFKDEHGRNMLSYEKNHDDIFASATGDVVNEALSLADEQRKTYIDAKFVMKKGECLYFEASYNGKLYTATGTKAAEPALNTAVDAERAEQQLRKLGSTVLEFSNLDIDVEDGLFIPVKEINLVRREVCEQIEKEILGSGRVYRGEGLKLPVKVQKNISQPLYTASVLNEAQADACYELGFSKIYIPYSLYKRNKSKYNSDPDVYAVKLPPVNHDSKREDYSDIALDTVCITNIGQISLVPDNINMHADYRLNVFNSYAFNQLANLGVKSACFSTELSLQQMKDISTPLATEVLVYGRIPLMTVKNCVLKSSLGRCGCTEGELYYLRDRKKICFPLECIKGECINIIYNSAPLYMADRTKELARINANLYRFDFTDETPAQMAEILKSYETGRKSNEFFTRGHFYNEVQ